MVLDKNGNAIPTGIDKIKITLKPHLIFYLNQAFIYLTNNQKKGETWYNTNSNQLCLYTKFTPYNNYLYLIIQAEYIYRDQNRTLKDIISEAIFFIINQDTIKLNDYMKDLVEEWNRNNITQLPLCNFKLDRNFIRDNLKLFVYQIKELEIYFDMKASSITLLDDIHIFDSKTPSFHFDIKNYQKSQEYKKGKALIKYNTTYYTIDEHHKRNKSTGKVYDRKQKLLDVKTSNKWSDINDYPYDTRLEFLLTNKNTNYTLNLLNVECTPKEVIDKYYTYLKIYLTKYINGIFQFKDIGHLPLLQTLYYDSLFRPQTVCRDKSIIQHKEKYPKSNDIYLYDSLLKNLLSKEFTKQKNSYLMNMISIKKILNNEFILGNEYVNPFGIYNSGIDKGYKGISIDNEYSPLGKYWLTPNGYVNIENIHTEI
jgi:hypothetical protein